MEPLKFVIVAQSESSFQLCRQQLLALGFSNVIWCDARLKERRDLINENLQQWLCFLDHDCSLTAKDLALLMLRAEEEKTGANKILAGRYRTPRGAGYFQRVHNLIANLWLEHSYTGSGGKFFLGGAFLVFATQPIPPSVAPRLWGAEDKLLAFDLTRSGFDIELMENFSVDHLTSSSATHFVKRAWLHGVNEVKYLPAEKKRKLNFLFLLQKVGFAELYLLPLVVLHFCIQKGAKSVQKVRQRSTPGR